MANAADSRRYSRRSRRARYGAAWAAVLIGLPLIAAPVMVGEPDGTSPHPFGKPTTDNPNPNEDLSARTGTRPSGTWEDQTRSEVLGRHGMVSTSQPLASEAGLDILKEGGNAIDAAIAAASVLTITEPGSHSLGGDTWAILWSAEDQQLHALNSSGPAPAGWSVDYFEDKGHDEIPGRGPDAITVPGAVSGWDALLDRFGTMTFDETLERAATLAEEGFPVGERTARDIAAQADALDDDLAETWLIDGAAPLPYDILTVPDHAEAFRELQKGGRDAFYDGDIGKAIVNKVESLGGVMTLDDLAEFESEWVDPVSTNYHGYDVHQLPPNNQGFAALQMLNILEVCVPELGFDLAELGLEDPQYYHLMVEAKKLAYADLLRYNADPRFEEPPLDTLLDKDHAASLCDEIDPDKARPAEMDGNLDGGTVYFTTADRWGNMVSFVSSTYSGFGSKVGVPGYGVPLQNRGQGFVLEEGHPNVVEPGKRPFHTIMAGFITQDDEPLMAFGNMGGATQPQAHAQHVVNMIDHGLNVQATGDVARFDHAQPSDELSLDVNLAELVGGELESMGHSVQAERALGGGYQGILFERDPDLPKPEPPPGNAQGVPLHEDPINGIYRAGADHRKDGSAMGW